MFLLRQARMVFSTKTSDSVRVRCALPSAPVAIGEKNCWSPRSLIQLCNVDRSIPNIDEASPVFIGILHFRLRKNVVSTILQRNRITADENGANLHFTSAGDFRPSFI